MTVATLKKILELVDPETDIELEISPAPSEYHNEEAVGIRAEVNKIVILGKSTL